MVPQRHTESGVRSKTLTSLNSNTQLAITSFIIHYAEPNRPIRKQHKCRCGVIRLELGL